MNIDFSLPYGTIWNVIVLAFIFLWMFFWLITVIFMGRIRYVKFREERAYNDIYTQLVSFIQQCTSTLQQGQEKSSLLFSKNGVSISNDYQMRAVRRLLLSYYELFKGDYRAQIVNIIKVNHLQHLATNLLNRDSPVPRKTINVIDNFSLLNEPLPEDIVDKLLQSSNERVVKAVREHLIRVQGTAALPQLFHTMDEISDLQVIELYETIRSLNGLSLQLFHSYLSTDNTDNKNILILHIMTYKQELPPKEILLALLENGSDKLSARIINSIGKLLYRDFEQHLIALFSYRSQVVKLEILKALGRISSGKSLSFLSFIFKSESYSILMRMHAYKSLLHLERRYSHLSLPSLEEIPLESDKIKRFIEQPLIKYI